MPPERFSQVVEISYSLTGYTLEKSVTPTRRGGWVHASSSLHAASGERKYLNAAERRRVLAAIKTLDTSRSLFAQVLAWTGARVSEVLALTPRSFDPDSGVVSIVTLKRRKFCVRQVPIPPQLMRALTRHFQLHRLQADNRLGLARLWTFCRMTAWRTIKRVMATAYVVGRQACPKGLRHAFGVSALQATVPVTILQRWMGHARLQTTAIYLNVSGSEEALLARRFWRFSRRAKANSCAE